MKKQEKLREEESELIKEIEKKEKEISKVKDKLKNLSYKKRVKKIVSESKFMEFFKRKKFSPVLEKVEEKQEEVKLEKIALTSPEIKKPIEKSEFKYTSDLEKKNDIKYSNTSNIVTSFVENNSNHKSPIIQERPTIEYKSTHEANSNNLETYVPVGKVKDDQDKLSPREKENLSRKEIKYKSSV